MTVLSVAALLLLMTAYTMFDIATVIILLDQSWQNRKACLPEVLRVSSVSTICDASRTQSSDKTYYNESA